MHGANQWVEADRTKGCLKEWLTSRRNGGEMMNRNSTGAAFGKMVSPIVAGTASELFLERQSANVFIPLSFHSELAGASSPSVRSDKALGMERHALVVSRANRTLYRCRPAEHEP